MAGPETDPEAELAKLLDRLMQQVVLGKAHLSIWRGLANALGSEPDVAHAAPGFFGLTLQAHLEASLLYAARLFDTHPEAVTVKSLLRLAEENASRFENARPEEVVKSVVQGTSDIRSQETSLSAVKTRRDKALAHLDPKTISDPGKVGEQSKLTIKELEDLFGTAEKILNNMSAKYRGVTSFTELLDKDDYENVVRLVKLAKRTQKEEFEREFGPLPYLPKEKSG